MTTDGHNQKTNTATDNAVIKIILADTQAIYRVGTKKIFALEDDIRVVAQAETLGQVLAAAQKYPADVILFESAVSSNPAEAVSEVLRKAPGAKIIVLVAEADEEDTLEFFRRGVKGIITRAISPELLVRCVRKVAEGETWLDNQGVSWVVEAYRQQAQQLMSPRQKTKLSDKELLIISCVTQGMRNKEIASEIGTTEQVIKNYLRKVYDKLGVSDRLELALYCIHHQLLKPAKGDAVLQGVAAAMETDESATAQGA
ncbi:MAG TPA: response regulator transcription factor [Terriglobales bacterium]|jgi:DNA-binding NarL/FixJ family response regulator